MICTDKSLNVTISNVDTVNLELPKENVYRVLCLAEIFGA